MGFAWPEGKRAAASLTFDVDAESAILSLDKSSAGRMSVMSHQAYGPTMGVPRLLRLLAGHEVKATFFVPGYTAERYPDVVRAVVDEGHEIAHHGYLHELLVGVDVDQEREILLRGLEALDSVAGVRPTGYRAPMWELNYHSPGLLHEHGFLYDSSLMDADRPYELALTPGGTDSVVELPISWSSDDWGQFCFIPDITGTGIIESPSKTLEMWRADLEAAHEEQAMFMLVNHPFLSGRPARASAIGRLIEEMKSLPGLWIATCAEIAEHTRSLHLQPTTLTRPEIEER
jgi:peptidoglycan/xylan/chitin deacetylase (PgdA/CDA1 family)